MSYFVYQTTEFVKMRTETNQQRTAQSWQKKMDSRGHRTVTTFLDSNAVVTRPRLP